MKKIVFLALLAGALLSGCQNKPAYKAALLEFMAKGCPACEKIRPMIDEIKAEYKGLADIRVYDVTTAEGEEKTGIYGLKGTPTLIFLDENGVEYFRLEKTIQKDIIEAVLNQKTGAPRVRR